MIQVVAGQVASTAVRHYLGMECDDQRMHDLGRVVEAGAMNEHLLQVLFTGVIGVGQGTATLLIAGQNHSWIADRCAAVAKHRLKDEPRQAVLTWITDSRALMDKRNTVVHSTWLWESDTVRSLVKWRKGHVDALLTTEAEADLPGLADALNAVNGRFLGILRDHFAAGGPSPFITDHRLSYRDD